MPSLTYLAFPGARKGDGAGEDTYHIHEAKSLLRHAPNLRTLVAPDCWGGYELEAGVYKDDPWDVPLPRLRKLSLNGISVLGLERILHSCPVLEDLEYYDAPLLESWWVVLNPERHLSPVRETLRRFRYSVFFDETFYPPQDGGNGADSLQGMYFYSGDDVGNGQGLDASSICFSSFPVLEQLELEQLLLYGPIFSPSSSKLPRVDSSVRMPTPEEFLAKMPPSLRRLRVGGIISWQMLYRDLVVLAEESSRFPKLEAIVLEVYITPPQDEYQHLVELFRATSGVSVSLYYSAKIPRPESRGLLPARPGQPKVIPVPVTYS